MPRREPVDAEPAEPECDDATPLVQRIRATLDAGDVDGAERLAPVERPYPLSPAIARVIGIPTKDDPSDEANPAQ